MTHKQTKKLKTEVEKTLATAPAKAPKVVLVKKQDGQATKSTRREPNAGRRSAILPIFNRNEVKTICTGTNEFNFQDRDVKVWTGAPGFNHF